MIKRAYKYRFYPTPEQADLLNRTFGCLRPVWNKALAERTRRYKDEGKHTSYVETAKWLTAWKQDPEFGFLREVSNVPLQQCLRAQQNAFSGLARAISDASWSQLRGMLEYKCRWYGRELLLVDRWFPSTRLCSTPRCGRMNQKMPLNVRSWTCPRCGTVQDRDVNAAKNILAVGLADK